MTGFIAAYLPLLALGFGIISLTVLLWTVSTAFWSISRTMKDIRTIWSASEDTLARLKALVKDLEDTNDRRKF